MSFSKTVKLRMDCDLIVTADEYDGRGFVVSLVSDNAFANAIDMHPHEAERVGRALLDAVAFARAKIETSLGPVEVDVETVEPA